MNCEFKFAARQQYNGQYVIQPHTHPCYELVYYLNGSGDTTIGQKTYRFAENTFCITKPNEIHSEKSNDSALVLFVGFSCDNFLPEASWGEDKVEAIKKTLFEIEAEIERKQSYYQSIIETLTQKLIYQIMRIFLPMGNDDNNFKYILNYVESCATQKISVNRISYNLGYNYDYLRQLFYRKTGKTLKEYFLDLKLKNVKNYLVNYAYSVAEIANLTGFSSPSHLCMVFRKKFNVSPTEYRIAKRNSTMTDNMSKDV